MRVIPPTSGGLPNLLSKTSKSAAPVSSALNMEEVLMKQQRLLEEEANQLWIVINQMQLVTRNKGTPCTEGGESLQVAEVEKKHAPTPGRSWTQPQGPVGGPMAKKSKAGGDLVQGPLGKKGVQQRKSAPKRRADLPRDVGWRGDNLNQGRATSGECRPQWHCSEAAALQEIWWYQKPMDLLIQSCHSPTLCGIWAKSTILVTSPQSPIAGRVQLSGVYRRPANTC